MPHSVVYPGAADFTKILTELYNESSNANALVRRVLNLPEGGQEDTERGSTGLSAGVISAIVIAIALVTGGTVVAVALLVIWRKRYGKVVQCCLVEHLTEHPHVANTPPIKKSKIVI